MIKEDYKLEQIRSVKLAGGFGNYINIENAIHIGLLPRGLKAEISSVGNSAGTGAVMCALSKEIIDDCCGFKASNGLSGVVGRIRVYTEN